MSGATPLLHPPALCLYEAVRCKFNSFYFKLLPCSECSILYFWAIRRRLSFMWPRFGAVCVFRLYRVCEQEERTAYTAYEYGTDTVFRNVGI